MNSDHGTILLMFQETTWGDSPEAPHKDKFR